MTDSSSPLIDCLGGPLHALAVPADDPWLIREAWGHGHAYTLACEDGHRYWRYHGPRRSAKTSCDKRLAAISQ